MIVVDRIEAERALVEFDGEVVEIPVSALPRGSTEGALLVLQPAKGDDSAMKLSNEAVERLERLRSRDPGDKEIDI